MIEFLIGLAVGISATVVAGLLFLLWAVSKAYDLGHADAVAEKYGLVLKDLQTEKECT